MASFEWPPTGGSGGVSSVNTLTGALTLAAGSGISITPSGGNTLTIAATITALVFSDSLVNSAGTVTLVNDSATPGNSQYYGTNSGGTLGYFSLPASGANITLSNLTSPTAINQNLIFASGFGGVTAFSGGSGVGGGALTLAGGAGNATPGTAANVNLNGGPGDGSGGSASFLGGNAAGNNKAGGGLLIAGGTSTGSANGGNIVFETSPAGSSGSSANALVVVGSVTSSGGWTIGQSGGVQTHQINGSTSTPGSGVGTLTNLPGALSGNPTGYLLLEINGSFARVPFW
jgi:hypothetical protein